MKKTLKPFLGTGIVAFFGGLILMGLLGTNSIKEQTDVLTTITICSIIIGAVLSVVFGVLLAIQNAKVKAKAIVNTRKDIGEKDKKHIENALFRIFFMDFWVLLSVVWLVNLLFRVIFFKSYLVIPESIFSMIVVCQIQMFWSSTPSKEDLNVQIKVSEQGTKNPKINIKYPKEAK